MADAEGMITKVETINLPDSVILLIAYGGHGKKIQPGWRYRRRPESFFYLKPEYCKDNRYSIYKNMFQLSYGFTKAQSEEERYEIQYGNKQPDSAAKKNQNKSLVCFLKKGK